LVELTAHIALGSLGEKSWLTSSIGETFTSMLRYPFSRMRPEHHIRRKYRLYIGCWKCKVGL